MRLQLHHFAYNITANNLELVIDLMEKLECTVTYREPEARWCMISTASIPISIQVIEVKDKPIPITRKVNSHIAFLSNSPEAVMEELKQWALDKNLKFKAGGWSTKELWFDLPEVFVNFVIEVMHTSIVE